MCDSPGTPLSPSCGFSRGFHGCTHWHFQVAGFSSIWSGIHEAKRSPEKFTDMSFFSPRALVSCLLSTLQRFYVCFIYNVHGFQLLSAGGGGKSTFTPSSRKQKSFFDAFSNYYLVLKWLFPMTVLWCASWMDKRVIFSGIELYHISSICVH